MQEFPSVADKRDVEAAHEDNDISSPVDLNEGEKENGFDAMEAANL
eukprot:CAMPEP_0113324082 /NCGR_PEP_ID=MMETSP0010_2-20120614/16803_1 /TAXON_ID=216773 ORGANISM="Corethron hystrix, Strain 308" /NCGR_SAMPLE_ID=MMETSP0010_2 /ASSEMBLY_ACC=CAM_ASM_000155 /LENGTH=45 /DNA_ID=CAMNT_0000183333 /DNA_START=176 /DNA_END=313 /DNA_ORIENTATION=- /assembly_acc=CAM_ASM_000155